MTVGGSQQLRIWRRARRDGATLMTACAQSGIPLAEARLWDAEDRANPPGPECFELLGTAPAVEPDPIAEMLRRERCELCADWRPQPDGLGECWSGDRLDGDMTKGPAGWSRATSGCEAWNPKDAITTAPVGAPPEKEDDMARPKKQPQVEQVHAPDFALAVRIWREDIKPAQSKVGEFAQEQSTAYKEIKKRAYIQPQAAKLAFKLDGMEESKRDDFLRGLNGLLKTLNIFMPRDLVDAAEGAGAIGDGVIPAGERPRPKLVTIPAGPADGSDSDLAGENPEPETGAPEASDEEHPQAAE